MTPPQRIDMECFDCSERWAIMNEYTAQLSNLVGGVMTPPYVRSGGYLRFKLQFELQLWSGAQGLFDIRRSA